MFAKGNRFVQAKPSEVPGPGAYDPQDPEYDAYKHGAFLEKQDRFNKEKASEVPGPGTYDGTLNPTRKPTVLAGKTAGDRYAVLQRKVDELERLYADAKKSHQEEVGRLKEQLGITQRTASDQADRVEKLKKQNDIQDTRLQELRKINLSDQSEIKDLRAKLRMAEHDRAKLSSKQGDASEAKKALQALDLKRRDELKERDRKLAEVERALATEKKRKEALEARLADMKGSVDSEVRQAQEATRSLDAELRMARAEAEQVKSSLATAKAAAHGTEEDLLIQLEQHRQLLSRVAEEYGRLASSTVSRVEHERVQTQSRALQFRVARLERKLANSEDQVVELANLIRWTKEQNKLLTAELRDSDWQVRVYASLLGDAFAERPSDSSLLRALETGLAEATQAASDIRVSALNACAADTETWANYDRVRAEHTLIHSALLVRRADEADTQLRRLSAELADAQNARAAATAELATARADQEATQKQWAGTVAELSASKAREEALRKEVETVTTRSKAEATKLRQAVTQEKEVSQRLATAVQTSRAAEEALRDEIDRLTEDLAEAEKYQEAYCNLIEEVDALVERNALAEDEARHLSTFNAEILGHHNPAQRIMYVDRIRQELHDLKLELLAMTRDRDGLVNENDELRHELDLYTSVAVPLQSKARTTVTRVTRAPLANHNMNASTRPYGRSTTSGDVPGGGVRRSLPEPEYKDGDMTLDEIS